MGLDNAEDWRFQERSATPDSMAGTDATAHGVLAGAALRKTVQIAEVARALDEVALPVPWHDAIVDLEVMGSSDSRRRACSSWFLAGY